jgi:hypothetical protein
VDRSPTSGFASNFNPFSLSFSPRSACWPFLSLSPLLGVIPSFIPERYLKSLRSDPTEKKQKKRKKEEEEKKPH